MKITGVESFLVEIPQRPPVAPYQSRYVATSTTQALLVRLETDSGLIGWGEAPQDMRGNPLNGREAVALRPALLGSDLEGIDALYGNRALDGTYLQSAVEMAFWDALGKARNRPLCELLGGRVRDEIAVAACMGIQTRQNAGRIARHYVELGFRTLKTKAGRDPEEDLELVRGVRDAVGDRLKLRIDPNTGYAPEVCEQLAKDLEPYGLEYLEQPMPAGLIDDSARIRRSTTTPLALNESVTSQQVVSEILEKQACDVLLPDTYQCGGIQAVNQVAIQAESAGATCVMHCAHDLGLKTAAMLHLVASSPAFRLANDTTYYALEDDILLERHTIERGMMRVPDAPGLGVEIDLEKVHRYTIAASC